MLNLGGDSLPEKTCDSVCLTGDKLFVMRLAEDLREEKETKAVEYLGLEAEVVVEVELELELGLALALARLLVTLSLPLGLGFDVDDGPMLAMFACRLFAETIFLVHRGVL